MMIGTSIRGTEVPLYTGPIADAIEYGSHEENRDQCGQIARDLRALGFKRVSCHLHPFMRAMDVDRDLAPFRPGDVDAYVVHVTNHTPQTDWKKQLRSGHNILVENHNQDWHPTDAGWCWADQFKEAVDAGVKLCLDTGHILYAASFKTKSPSEWIDYAERSFEAFVGLPIEQCHIHTTNFVNGVLLDHQPAGFDIGHWVKRIVAKHPDVTLIAEIMESKYSHEHKINALKGWLR